MNILSPPTNRVTNEPVVLLVEDSLADARYVEEMLSEGTYRLQHVGSLAAAQDFVAQQAVKVILLDLSLPDAHGIETFLSMNAVAPSTPILVLTGLDDQDISILAVQLGAQDYVLKREINEQTLSRSIRYAIERKRIEEAVKISEQQAKETETALKLALDASQTGIWSYDSATGKITQDDQIEKIFGVEPGMFGEDLQDFINRVHIDDRARVAASFESATNDAADYAAEYRIVWTDGSIHHILAKGNAYRDEPGKPARMRGVCVDISKRKEVEERLTMALKASHTGTWMRELDTGKMFWDDQMHALLGVTPGEFVLSLENFLQLIVPADVENMMTVIREAVAKGTEFKVQYRAVWPDGSVHFIEARGQAYLDPPRRMVGISVDISDRKLAEQERLQLAAIVESSNDAIISKTLDGTISSWNRAAERIYGYSAKQMIGQSISLLIPADLADELPNIIMRLKRGERIEQQETLRRREDGTIIDVSLTISPIKDATGVIIGASTIVRDITKRKRTECLLSAQYSVTRILSESDSLADAAPRVLQVIGETTGCDVCELREVDKEQNVLTCVDVWHKDNAAVEEFEAITRHITFSMGIGLPGLVWSHGERIWIDDLSTHGNFPRAKIAAKVGLRNGSGFPILRGSQVVGAICFFGRAGSEPDAETNNMLSSISAQLGQFMDRKAAERLALEATRAEQTTARAILENAPIGIARLNSNLEISEANNVFSQQFGLDRNDLIGRFIFEIPTGIPNQRLIDVVQQGVPYSVSNFQNSLNSAQGPRHAYCDLTVWPVKDAGDLTIGLIVLTVEVTERVKLAKQREDFVATLTHDLKNPLIGQDRMLELILDGHLGPLQTEQAKMLALLKTGTKEQLELISTLLEVYRYEAGAQRLHREEIDLAELISGCIAQLKPVAEGKGINITVATPTALNPIYADRMSLKRVVANLLDNAIKFTPSGGFVRISCQSTASELKVTIEDSGSGISAEELSSLFQRFAQARAGRRHKAGTGLGLYLCRGIIEAHAGTITCSSIEGSGSTFTVTLPVRDV